MGRYSPLEVRYKRVVLKLSGEALAGNQGSGIDYDVVLEICKNIKTAVQTLGVQMGIVVGGGNFWRGRSSGKMDRTRADHMGMLATVINALALADALESLDVPVRVQTAITMEQFVNLIEVLKLSKHLKTPISQRGKTTMTHGKGKRKKR